MKTDTGKHMDSFNIKRSLTGILLLLAFSLAGCGGSGSTRIAATGGATLSATGADCDSFPAGINQYFIAPNGDDDGGRSSCSEVAPCKTFKQAVSMLTAGDELVLKNGYYSLSENGTLNLFDDNGNGIPLSGQMPSGTSTQIPTIVRAENPGQVSIEGSLRLGLTFDKVQYIFVCGLTFHGGGSIYNGDFIAIKNSGFEGGFGIGTIDHDQGNTYNLVEDVWLWGENIRSLGSTYRSHHNTWRRVLLRGDGCDDDWCGDSSGNFSPGITVYNSHDTTLENVIVIDRILGANPYGYADFSTAQHDSNQAPQPEGELLGRNSWLGCMSLNSEDISLQFEADAVEDIGATYTIRDFVSLKNTGESGTGGFWIDGANRPYPGVSVIDADRVNVYPTAGSEANTLYIGCTEDDPSDPATDDPPTCGGVHTLVDMNFGAYAVRPADLIPQVQYGTSEPLWPWPNEDRIKAEMCPSVSRGFCGYNGTISEYVNLFDT